MKMNETKKNCRYYRSEDSYWAACKELEKWEKIEKERFLEKWEEDEKKEAERRYFYYGNLLAEEEEENRRRICESQGFSRWN